MSPIGTLVVDDNLAICALFRSILKSHGYAVLGELNKVEGVIGFLENHSPEVLVLDLDMQGSDGIEILQSILQRFPSLFVVVTTTDEGRAKLKAVFDIGAVGCLVKPFNQMDIGQMFSQLSRVIARVRAGTGATSGVSASPRKRAVVLDHSVAMQALICTLLEESGYEVAAVASSGMEGLLAIEAQRPHFVCLDMDMPELDGLSTLGCLLACHPSLPVIMITAHADAETVRRALSQRVAGYVLKPIEAGKLRETIRRALLRPRASA